LAQIAIPLYLVFIWLALRRDVRERRQVSSALWIPFLWIADCATKPLDLWIFPHQGTAFSQRIAWEHRLTNIEVFQSNPLERALFLILLGLGLRTLFKRRSDFAFSFKDNFGLGLFLLYSLVSIGWSDYQGPAIKRWIRLAGDLVMVLIILTEINPTQAIDQILRRFAILFIPLSIILVKYRETIGRIYTTYGRQMWVGVTGHKNQLGQLCAVCGILLLRRLLKKWPKVDPLDVGLFLLTVYLLLGAESQTAVLVFGLGAMIVGAQFLSKGDMTKVHRIILISLIVVLALQAVLIAVLDTSISDLIFSSTGRDSSLTGRVPLWQELISLGSRRPIFGSGYASFWSSGLVYELWDKVHWTPVSSHNGYIDIFMNLGLIGLLLLLIFLRDAYRNITRTIETDRERGSLGFVLFIVILLQNFAESTLSVANSFLWILLLVSAVVVRSRPRPLDEAPAGPIRN
jgi:O-antigen ligase